MADEVNETAAPDGASETPIEEQVASIIGEDESPETSDSAEVGETTAPEPDAAPEAKHKTPKEIARLTRLRRTAEREAAAAKEELAALRREVAEIKAKTLIPPEPTDDEFLEDPAGAKERLKAHLEAKARYAVPEPKESASPDAPPALPPYVADLQADGRDRFEDFDVKVGADGLPFTLENLKIVSEIADDPSGLLYHIASDPKAAEAIRRATGNPSRLAREIGRLEALIEAQGGTATAPAPSPAAEPAEETPPPPQSKTSADLIEPTRGRAPRPSRPSDKDSTADWIRKREAEIRGTGG